MSSAMMLERTGASVPTFGMPSFGTPSVATPSSVPVGSSWLMVPRCTTYKYEKCAGGFKLTCVCEDKVAGSMVQNLCSMLAGGLFSCSCVLNGMPVCYYNFTFGICKYEVVDNGVCFTCTSGDPQCAAILQACCDCFVALQNAGCTCFALYNNTPVCCSAYETVGTTATKTRR